MILKCASCQTRFKIGDDKVTEKGVKVRCTKCGTIFTVRKGDSPEGQAPSPPPSAEPLPGKSAATVPPFRAAPAASTPLSDLLGADLHAKPLPSTFVTPPPPPQGSLEGTADDPFASFMGTAPAPPRPQPDPTLMPGEFGLDAPPPAASPAATSPQDLLGLGPGWSEGPPTTASARPPSPFDAALDPLGGLLPTPSPGGAGDPFSSLPADPFGELPGAPSSAPAPNPPPTIASFGAEFDAGAFDPLAGLSLDPAAVSGETAPAPAFAPPPSEGLSAEGESSEFFDMPQKPPPARQESPVPAPTPSPESSVPAAARLAAVQERVRRAQAASEPALTEDKPLAARVFNALAGTSVVVLALLAFIAYRNGGQLDLHDPMAAAFSAFGFSRPVPPSQSLPTQIASSGFYPTLRGGPVLFVRGTVKNLSGAAVRVGLKLDVLVDGHTVASAEGTANQLPTPEDLYALKGVADLKSLQEKLAATPVPQLPVGASGAFVLVVPDPPESIAHGLQAAELAVTAHPLSAAAAAPGTPPAPTPPAGGAKSETSVGASAAAKPAVPPPRASVATGTE